MKRRIFDHLEDAPADEDRFFSRVARRMRSSPWWHEVPEWTEPVPVAGEIER